MPDIPPRSVACACASAQRRTSVLLIAVILVAANVLAWLLHVNQRTPPDFGSLWLIAGLPWVCATLFLGYLLRHGSQGRTWPWVVWSLCLLIAVVGALFVAYGVALGRAWQN